LRMTITSISIKALTDGTGDLTVEGNIKIGSAIQSVNNINAMNIFPNGAVGIGTASFNGLNLGTNLGTKLLIHGLNRTGPYLGSPEGVVAILGTSGLWGLTIGVSSNGDSWLQSQRIDGGATTYNIQLNPSGGNVYMGGKLGIGSVTYSYALSLSGTTANTIGNERHTTATTAGLGLTIRSGGCTAASSNKGGVGLILIPDYATGTRGTTKIELQRASRTAAATTDNVFIPQFEILSAKPLVDNANDTLFSVVINSDSSFACTFDMELTVNNATDRQARSGTYRFVSGIKTGALVTPVFQVSSAIEDLGGGTLAETLTYSYVKATSTLYLIGKWDSSLNPTVGQMMGSITIINMKGTSSTPSQY